MSIKAQICFPNPERSGNDIAVALGGGRVENDFSMVRGSGFGALEVFCMKVGEAIDAIKTLFHHSMSLCGCNCMANSTLEANWHFGKCDGASKHVPTSGKHAWIVV